MHKILVTSIILACVEMSMSQYTKGENAKYPYKEHEPFSPEDFKKPPKIEDPKLCHQSTLKCMAKTKGKIPVCGVDSQYGLLNFQDVCSIHLYNCMARMPDDDTAYGIPTESDIVYFNGKNYTCHYYYKKTENIEDAVKLYYKVGNAEKNFDNNNI